MQFLNTETNAVATFGNTQSLCWVDTPTKEYVVAIETFQQKPVILPAESDWRISECKEVGPDGLNGHLWHPAKNAQEALGLLVELWGGSFIQYDFPCIDHAITCSTRFHNLCKWFLGEPFVECSGIKQVLQMTGIGTYKKLPQYQKILRWPNMDWAKCAALYCISQGLASGFETSSNKLFLVGVKMEKRYLPHIAVGETKMWLGRKSINLIDQTALQQIQAIFAKEAKIAATNEWYGFFEENGPDVVRVPAINKKIAFLLIETPPTGYDVLWRKKTDNGNTIVILGRIKPKMKCPQEFRGKVIGNKGAKIQALTRKHRLDHIDLV